MPKVSEEHLRARRRQIIRAALVCLSLQGFHRTTMQDIVQESGLSVGAFYRYFESKEAIVAAARPSSITAPRRPPWRKSRQPPIPSRP